MNENHEEQRQRTDRESEGPRILSIRELEPEEKAPPGPPTREYPPERIRRPGIPPRIVEEPRRESGKRKILHARDPNPTTPMSYPTYNRIKRKKMNAPRIVGSRAGARTRPEPRIVSESGNGPRIVG